MADDYIYVRTSGGSDLTGFKLITNLTVDVGIFKGIDTTDISIPTSTTRSLLPVSGLKTDPTLEIELIDDGTNKCFSVDNIGNETDLSKSSTKDQLNFILDSLMSAELTAVYDIRIDWLDRVFTGLLTVNAKATGDKFYNNITLSANLKVGTNIFGV